MLLESPPAVPFGARADVRADAHPEPHADARGAVDGHALLALWERAMPQPAGRRADVLLREAYGSGDQPPLLGERNALLLTLHARLFGVRLDLLSHCPTCGTAAEFTGDCHELAESVRPMREMTLPLQLETAGYVIAFRLPTGDDLAWAWSAADDSEAFAVELVRCCVLSCTSGGVERDVAALPASVLDALSQRMEELDPGATLSFELECPACAERWRAPLDVGDVLWQKTRASAERLLLDIDALASAYGWTESEILALSPLRRAAYLQLVTS